MAGLPGLSIASKGSASLAKASVHCWPLFLCAGHGAPIEDTHLWETHRDPSRTPISGNSLSPTRRKPIPGGSMTASLPPAVGSMGIPPAIFDEHPSSSQPPRSSILSASSLACGLRGLVMTTLLAQFASQLVVSNICSAWAKKLLSTLVCQGDLAGGLCLKMGYLYRLCLNGIKNAVLFFDKNITTP